jgi:hypothetical protein
LLGDFNVPGFDWNSGLPSLNSHLYTKLKGDVIHSATCFLGLIQHNYSDSGRNFLDLVFSNFADLTVDHPANGLVQLDNFHPPFIIECTMPVRRIKQNCNIFYKKFSAGNYAVLYNALYNCEWSSLYNETSVDAAVDRLNFSVTQAIDLAVPSGHIKKHKYPDWFSGKLENDIKKKNYFYRRYKKYKTGCADSIHLDMDDVVLNKPRDIAEAFSKHFHSIYSSSCYGTSPSVNQGAENLRLAPVFNSDVQNAIERLRPSKSVGIDEIPSFVIKGCCEIFVPALRFIFDLSLSQNIFLNLWKQSAIIPVFKKGKISLV